jgi:hypothetical protein
MIHLTLFKNYLAKASTITFPRIPTWLGIKHNLTDLVLKIIEVNLKNYKFIVIMP